jgi:hypothetical protein
MSEEAAEEDLTPQAPKLGKAEGPVKHVDDVEHVFTAHADGFVQSSAHLQQAAPVAVSVLTLRLGDGGALLFYVVL